MIYRQGIYLLVCAATLLFSACGSNEKEDGASSGGNNAGSTGVTQPNTPEVNNPVENTALSIEVLDKRVDINESASIHKIRLRVIKGIVGAKDVSVRASVPEEGSFVVNPLSSDAAGDIVFEYKAPDTLTPKQFELRFCLAEDNSVCDTAAVRLTQGEIEETTDLIDNINYLITFAPNNGVNNMTLGARNNAIVTLIDKDTQKPIEASRIESISVTSKDATVLKLTPEGGGLPVSNITYGASRNSVPVLLTADKVNSGIAIIEVIIKYKNLNGISKERGQLFSVAVLSGEATAFSINEAGVAYNFETKQFEQKYIIQATDNSGNPIATRGVINVSAMASFAKDASGREILYGRQSGGVSATISPANGKATLELSGLAPFDTPTIKQHRAYVAVFGEVDTYEVNGKWNIESILSGNQLQLIDEYHGDAYSNLGMAIGYNYRDKICTSTYEEAVVVIDSSDGKYEFDENGKAFVTLKHDAYMIGKRILLMVNMTGFNPQTKKLTRTGEVYAETLAFTEFLKGATFKIPKGSTVTVRMPGVIQTGTKDEFPLQNSTFSCSARGSSGITNITLVAKNNPNDCVAPYIEYSVTASGDADGSFVLSDCQVDLEPRF